MNYSLSKSLFFINIWFLCLSMPFYGQIPKDYKELKRYILSDLAANNIEMAFAYTDTLSKISTTKEQEISAEMVRAVLYYQKGEIGKALSIAVDAEKAFSENKNYPEQIQAIGFISSNFNELGLSSEALYYLDKATKYIAELPDGSLKGQYGTLLNHEKIGIYTEQEEFDKADKYIESAYEYVEQIEIPRQKDFFLSTTMYLDAENAYNLKKYDKSKLLLDSAYKTLGTKDDLLYGQIQLGYAQLDLADKEYEKAKTALDIVKEMAESSQYFPLKKDYYKIASDYYKAVNDSKLYVNNYKLYLEILHADERRTQKIADKTLVELRKKIQSERNVYNLAFGIGSFLIVALILIVYTMHRQNKRRTQRFKEVMKKLKEGRRIEETIVAKSKPDTAETNFNDSDLETINISEDTENRIYQELNILEKTSTFYLNSEITLTKLATQLDTNTKYVTHIIRKYYRKNFNNYINDLRIFHILKLLQENPEYSQYKISYLAQENGFSSHSKFSREFKRVVGLTPSVFINQMEENR